MPDVDASVAILKSTRKRSRTRDRIPDPPIGVSDALLGLAAERYAADEITDAVTMVAAWQDGDGAFYTLPPISPPLESNVTPRRWAMRALQLDGEGSDRDHLNSAVVTRPPSRYARRWTGGASLAQQLLAECVGPTHSSRSSPMNHPVGTRSLLRLLCFFVFAAFAPLRPTVPVLQAQAIASLKLDAALATRLSQVAPGAPLEVVIVFSDISAAPTVRGLSTKFIQMRTLPMAGAVLTAAQIRTIAEWPQIHSITLNARLTYFLAESVPLIKADQVWSAGETGANTTVAVIDSGIDGTHPDLSTGSKVIQNVKVLPFAPSLENQALTDTTSGHGTHVAGTIGGTGVASGGYYRGVAPDVKLVGLGAGEVIAILTATQAYDWVLTHHAEYNIRVVSNSWGTTGGEINLRNPVVMATFEAYKKGILSVFAAGNDGGSDVMNPYSLAPWVLAVAAGSKAGALADFSSRGKAGDAFKHPDITAPGVDIFATRTKTVGITALDPFPNPVNATWTPYYTMMSGTSMATPHVSGAAALLFSSNPMLSPDQVIDALVQTTTPMPAYALHEAGYGYLNALAAYQASRTMTGNLTAFLAGDRDHSEAEVLGFDPNQPVTVTEQVFTGSTAAGAGGVPAIDHPFDVGSGTLYVDVRVTWSPQIEDAYDVEILDPDGTVVVSSGNSVGEAETALFAPKKTGRYVLRLNPFAAVGAQYEARVRMAQ
jgi:serine protease AprX